MLFLLCFSVVFSHCTVQASVLFSVIDFSDNQLLLITNFFRQPTSSDNQLLLTQITSTATSSYTRLCNFLKILLGGKKVPNANTRARSFSFGGFWLESPDVRLQALLTPAGGFTKRRPAARPTAQFLKR